MSQEKIAKLILSLPYGHLRHDLSSSLIEQTATLFDCYDWTDPDQLSEVLYHWALNYED